MKYGHVMASDWYPIHRKDRLFEDPIKSLMAGGAPSSVNWIGHREFWYAWIHVPTGNVLLVAAEGEQFTEDGSAELPGVVYAQIHYPGTKITRTLGAGLPYVPPEERFQSGKLDVVDALRQVAADIAARLGIPFED
jgi:hypothetical protein